MLQSRVRGPLTRLQKTLEATYEQTARSRIDFVVYNMQLRCDHRRDILIPQDYVLKGGECRTEMRGRLETKQPGNSVKLYHVILILICGGGIGMGAG
jgi:hypothetical protein